VNAVAQLENAEEKPLRRQSESRRRPLAAVRVMLVDDHPAVRRTLRGLLEEEPDLHVLATLDSPEEALAVARRTPLDVAVVDYQLAGRRSGLWLSRELKRLPRPPRVLVYSAYADGLLAAASVAALADGVLSKGGPGSDLADAIRTVTRRRIPLPVTSSQLTATLRARLTEEERLLFGMLLAGLAVDELAEVLDRTPAWVDARLCTMMGKLDAAPARAVPDRRHERLVARARRPRDLGSLAPALTRMTHAVEA
jgi:two-component system, NarL family, response regulator DevR